MTDQTSKKLASQRKSKLRNLSAQQLLEIEHFHSNIPAVHDAVIWLC